MQIRKNEIIQFVRWTRNGIAFCTTWFLILVLVFCALSGIDSVSAVFLMRMMLLITGDVLIFNLCFSRLLLRNRSFTWRLTFFMCAISVYEIAGFYWLGFFQGIGSAVQWILFIAIVLSLYLICLLLYRLCSAREAERFTQNLQTYQKRRILEKQKEQIV